MTSPDTPEPPASARERLVKEIIYATACRYEGHESSCNSYDCTRHEHPEVKAVRRLVRAALEPESR